MRIEVGYGLEAVIPDGVAGRIIRERMAPAFREGDYYGGIVAAVADLELAARREYPDESPSGGGGRGSSFDLGALFFGFLMVGVVGNALGVLAGMIGGAFVLTVFGGGVLGWWSVPAGALLGLFTVLLLRDSGRRGNWTSGPSTGGGGWSGGGWSGGRQLGGRRVLRGWGQLRWRRRERELVDGSSEEAAR